MRILISALFMIVICASAHSQKNNLYHGYVKFEAADVPGTVTLTSTGFGKKKTESIIDSQRAAFYALLFLGIPGSQYEFPLITDESVKEHPAVKALFNKDYSFFIMESIMQAESKKINKKDGANGIMTLNRITINYDALKRHLEQKAVIRKFGI